MASVAEDNILQVSLWVPLWSLIADNLHIVPLFHSDMADGIECVRGGREQCRMMMPTSHQQTILGVEGGLGGIQGGGEGMGFTILLYYFV